MASKPSSRIAHALAQLYDDADVTKTLDLARAELSAGNASALAIAIGSKAGTLTTINLQNSGLQGAGCRAVCEAASSCEQLREMRLCGNDIADEGGAGVGDMLNKSTTLARLELRYCNIGAAGSTALFNAISKSYTLEELNLSGNAITDSTARALASSLASTISLTRLNLADTGLQETGCRLLCEGAKASPIVELLMPFNQVTDKMVVSLAGYLRTSSRLTCLNLHSCGIEADGLLELAEGVRNGPMRKGILKLTGIDLSNVADQLPLPIREGLVWDNESILEDFRHQIEDREHGLSAGRPSTRGSRPPTRASVDTETDTSTHEGDGDEEQDTKDDAPELAIPRALERLRAKDESFTKLLINRQSSMMASLSERATVIAAKAEGEAQRAHIMDREPLLVVAKEKKRAMNRAEAALEAECIKIGELRALGAALQMTRLLTELKLFDCGIRASGCKVLCLGDRGEQDKRRVGLVNCVSLKILDLSFNALDDDGAEHLAQVLASKRCSALATVKLNRCGIHERGMLAIAIGARLGPLRAHPLVLFGVTLALITPQLHLPNPAGGWNTQKLLAFFHHEHGGEVGDVVSDFKPTDVVGRTKEEETEAAAAAGQLRVAQEASRRAAVAYIEATKNLAIEKQKGKDEEIAATCEASAAAQTSLAAASVLLTPELRKEFDEWDQAFEREFADREKQSYRQWQDSIIDIDRVIP